jgi:Undecaprenyl-phosphate galactose phosphotransferase WbaP
MSTAAMAPERLPSRLNEDTQGEPRPFAHHRQVLCAFCLVLADVLAILISLRSAIFLRAHIVPLVDTHVSPLRLPLRHYLDFGWLWLLLVVFLGVEGLYTQRRTLWNEIGHLTKAIVSGLMVIFAAIELVQRGPVLSRLTILLTAVILLMVLPTVRYWAKRILGVIGLWRKRILILGATNTAKLAIRGLASDPVLGYEVVGLLDDDPMRRGKCFGTFRDKPIFILGNLGDAPEQMGKTRARDVLIAMPNLEDEKLLALVHGLQPRCESIYVVPQLWGLPLMNLQVDGFLPERVMMLKLSNNLAKPWNIWMKRGFDLLVGTAVTLFALPLCIVLAVLIKLDSEGPALFVQERLGYRGSKFRCVKFRTMRVNGDEMLAQYLVDNSHAADEWQRYAKLRDYDPRLTRLGRFLRRWSLDELPQLLNVLKGDMSLVGPRPYLPQERGRIGVDLLTILSSRPGMTGFWQVTGRNQLTLEDRVQLEAWYIRSWTVWFDCIILAKTFRTVFFPQNGCEVASKAVPDATAPNPILPDANSPRFVTRQRDDIHQTDSP